MNLAESVLEGSRLALSRLLTQVENDTSLGRQVLSDLFAHTGSAHLVGVTGAPGTGKSSLVNALARRFRSPADGVPPVRVAIVAVDPSSPFTGGAILGDRIRMRDLSGDSGVFIRSMASRGSLGGLARATAGVVQALDAAGFDVILIETVGVGQAEVDIARLAHTTLVVEAPGFGDDIQAIKAGILEIADILVINKADRPGIENTERALRGMLELAHPVRRRYSASHAAPLRVEVDPEPGVWQVPVLKTIATEGSGISELVDRIREHRAFLLETGEWQKRDRLRLETELEASLRAALHDRWRQSLPASTYQNVVDRLIERSLSPSQAVAELLGEQP